MRRVPLLAPLLKMRIIMADNPPRTGQGGVIYSELTGNVIPGGRPLGVNPAPPPRCKAADLLHASHATEETHRNPSPEMPSEPR